MTNKIFRSSLQLTTAVVSFCIIFILISLYSYLNRKQEERLEDEMKLVEAGFFLNGIDYLERLEKGEFRITLIHEGGEVLFDSKGKKEEMENHLNREEINAALVKGIGRSQRISATFLEKNSYLAKRQKDGSILRVAAKMLSFGGLVFSMLTEIAAVLLFALFPAVFLSLRLAKNIVQPINQIDLERPTSNEIYEELSPLLRRIEKQGKAIKSQITKLRQKNDEFLQVISCMKEGLVLLDKEKKILSINLAGKEFFEISEEWTGREFINICRDLELQKSLDEAIESGRAKFFIEKGERKYQFNISRIESQEEFIGLAIVIFDISERSLAEKRRREFSANVSHELKTPLQAIMGSAELLENGLVKKEDEASFIEKIREEAGRLLTLIEDIMKLSQLDECRGFEMEKVGVSFVIREVLSLLADKARKAEVSLVFEDRGNFVYMMGVKAMIMDVVYNLCENGIKYNKKGGEVRLSLADTEKEVQIFVRDTGIGIPFAHRDRVFERFYCVDKSRSKKSGGTGLGLAIVKHAVDFMGGEITLISEVGKGTEVKISLPKA